MEHQKELVARVIAARAALGVPDTDPPTLSYTHASETKQFDRYRELFDRPAHCDPRILHPPSECEYCAREEMAQAEREMLGVRNTCYEGEQPGRPNPCPAELARSKESLGAWGGNRPVPAVDYAASSLARSELGTDPSPCVCPVCSMQLGSPAEVHLCLPGR